VKIREKKPFEQLDGLSKLVTSAETELSAQGGRLLLRYSGTEPKARLLVEGQDSTTLKFWSEKICAAIQKQIGA
jgi:phosphoglucosamine mutase